MTFGRTRPPVWLWNAGNFSRHRRNYMVLKYLTTNWSSAPFHELNLLLENEAMSVPDARRKAPIGTISQDDLARQNYLTAKINQLPGQFLRTLSAVCSRRSKRGPSVE